jgi:hypothetical protein
VRYLLSFIFSLLLFNCGKNTNTPAIPLIFFNPPGIPQVAGIIPIYDVTVDPSLVADNQADKIPYKPEFVIKYYVTNTEQNFAGYNLSITSAVPSLADTQLAGSVYMENGIQPSFPHLAIEASTEATRLVRRRLKNRIPPPGLVPFQHCEIYTFTLRTYFNNGVLSNPSSPVSQCASVYPSKCPVGSSCNPTFCNTSDCSITDKNRCPVGTLCNPCTNSLANSGCECQAGQAPPGCNP